MVAPPSNNDVSSAPAVPYNPVPYNPVPYNAFPYHIVPYHSVPYPNNIYPISHLGRYISIEVAIIRICELRTMEEPAVNDSISRREHLDYINFQEEANDLEYQIQELIRLEQSAQE